MSTTTVAKRGAGTKKPKKVPLPRTPKFVDMKWYGQEPEFTSPLVDNDPRLSSAYNWYNYFYSTGEAKKWAIEWYTKTSPNTAKLLAKVPEGLFSTTVGWLCRMQLRDVEIPQQSRTFLTKKITEMLKPIQAKSEEKVFVPQKARFIQPGHMSLIANIEDMLDQFYMTGYVEPFNLYDYLSENDVKKAYAKAVAEYYRPLFEEIKMIARKDKDVMEAYSHLNKKQIDIYQKLLYSIVEDSERWYSNKAKITRTVRTPKKKSSEQLLKTFKFMKDNSALKVVSIDPASIIGASTLIAYNHKYKKLMIFTAKAGETLSVKGASITGYDEDKVTAKTLRKPEVQLQLFLNGTIAFMKKRYEEINSKPSVPSGRINEEVLLIKVFK